MRRLLILVALLAAVAALAGAVRERPIAIASPVPSGSPGFRGKVWDFPGHNLW